MVFAAFEGLDSLRRHVEGRREQSTDIHLCGRREQDAVLIDEADGAVGGERTEDLRRAVLEDPIERDRRGIRLFELHLTVGGDVELRQLRTALAVWLMVSVLPPEVAVAAPDDSPALYGRPRSSDARHR